MILTRELLSNGYAPVVIPIEDRAKYMDMLAKQDILTFAKYLEDKNKEEEKRMESFGIVLSEEGSVWNKKHRR